MNSSYNNRKPASKNGKPSETSRVRYTKVKKTQNGKSGVSVSSSKLFDRITPQKPSDQFLGTGSTGKVVRSSRERPQASCAADTLDLYRNIHRIQGFYCPDPSARCPSG